MTDQEHERRCDHELVGHGIEKLAQRRRDTEPAREIAVERVGQCRCDEYGSRQWIRPRVIPVIDRNDERHGDDPRDGQDVGQVVDFHPVKIQGSGARRCSAQVAG